MNSWTFHPSDSPVHRIDRRLALPWFGLLALLGSQGGWTIGLVFLVTLLVLGRMARVPWKTLAVPLPSLWILFAVLGLLQWYWHREAVGETPWLESWSRFVLTMHNLVVLALIQLQTSRQQDLVQAVGWYLSWLPPRWSHTIRVYIGLVLWFIPLIQDTWGERRLALESRLQAGGPRRPPALIFALAEIRSLLHQCLDQARDLETALVDRGIPMIPDQRAPWLPSTPAPAGRTTLVVLIIGLLPLVIAHTVGLWFGLRPTGA